MRPEGSSPVRNHNTLEKELARPNETEVSRCRDTFVQFPDQYHQDSTLDEKVSTLDECLDTCLLLPRARCAAINYNKDGKEGNRCYILMFTALSSSHGFYRGVDEYQRIQCDTVREPTFAPNRSLKGEVQSTAGSPPTDRSSTPSVMTSACPATYTKTPNRFGVGGAYLPPARTVEACLSACTADPSCPAVEYDVIVMTCYVHRDYFDGDLYDANGLNHYAKNPCGSPTTRQPLPSNGPLMTLLMTTAMTSPKTTAYVVKRTTIPDIVHKTNTGPLTRKFKPVTTLPVIKTTSTTTTIKTTSLTTSSTTASPTSSSTAPTKSTMSQTSSKKSTPSTVTSSTPTSLPTSPTNLPTATATVEEECVPSDLTIIFDTSGRSDGPGRKNFVHTVNLVKNVINNLQVGPDQTRVSAIIFSTLAVTAFHMEDHATKGLVLHAMDQLQYLGGLTNLPRAMRLWYDMHRPRSRALGRPSHVILLSDAEVSTIYEADFIEEAARWRTLTVTGELRSIVVNTPNVHTVNMDKFTPLHTFTVNNFFDIADIVYQVVSLMPCRDYTPLPFIPVETVVQESDTRK